MSDDSLDLAYQAGRNATENAKGKDIVSQVYYVAISCALRPSFLLAIVLPVCY